MKINKSSWHYRAISMAGFTPSKSLCLYFWQIPLITLLFAFAAFVCFTGSVAIVNALVAPLAYYFDWPRYFAFVFDGKMESAIAIASATWFFICLLLFTIYGERRKYRPKKPSLIREYISAKKQKICPLIEFED